MLLSAATVFADEAAVDEIAAETDAVEIIVPDNELSLEASVAVGMGAIVDYNAGKKVTVADMITAAKALEASEYVGERYFNELTYGSEVKNITAQAVMIDILGYSIFFDDGKIDAEDKVMIETTARKYNVSRGITKSADEIITMQDLAVLVYNTLKAKTVETVYSSNGNKSWVTENIYMQRVLGMDIVYGVVQSTSYSSVAVAEGTRGNTIIINGATYLCETGAYEEYIGLNVAALIKKTNNDLNVLSLYSLQNRVLEISADDINKNATTLTEISYYDESDRAREAELSEAIDVLYNYSLFADYTVDDFKLDQGRLVLIDNDNNGRYDIVKIEKYTSFRILSVSMDSKTIGDAYGNVVDIADLIENNYPVIENGKQILPQNIPTKAIATCYTNKNGDVVRLYIDDEKAAGMVQRFDEDRNIVVLEQKEFKYVNEIKAKLEAVPLGTLITVKPNHYGEIAYFEVSGDAVSYGYLIAFAGTGSPADPIKVKMYTQAGEVTVFEVADNIKLNGVRMSAKDAFAYNLTSGLWDEAGAISQPITYRRNSNNAITLINTATDDETDNRDRLHKEKDGNFTYFSTPKTICSDVRLNTNTKVFMIPVDLSEDRYYQYGSYNLLANTHTYTAQVYNVDENCYADCVVIKYNPGGLNVMNELHDPIYMVHAVGEALSDDKQLTTMLKVRQIGQSTEAFKEFVFMNSEVATTFQGRPYMVKDLKPGDVIMVTGANGVADYAGFKMLYRSAGTTAYEDAKMTWWIENNATTFYSDANTYAAGKIKRIISDGCVANFKPETGEFDDWNRVISFEGTLPVYICELSNNEYYRGSVADLQVGDNVFALMSGGNIREFIIYR